MLSWFAKSLEDVPDDLRAYVSNQASLAYNLGYSIAVWIENGKAHIKIAYGPRINGLLNPRNFIR